MNDTILNLTVIAAAFVAITVSTFGNAGSTGQTLVVQAPDVIEMQKTVVAAKRLPADALVGVAG